MIRVGAPPACAVLETAINADAEFDGERLYFCDAADLLEAPKP